MPATLLDEALEAWQYTRQSLIKEVDNLSAADVVAHPAPGARSAAEIVVHVAESGLMMAGELSRPDGDFTRQSFPAFMKEYAAGVKPTTRKRDLIRLLTRTHRDGHRQLLKAGSLHMLQYITQFNGEPATRLAWMSHGIAHEEYHRGQVALYARLRGKVPALTQLIHGRSAK